MNPTTNTNVAPLEQSAIPKSMIEKATEFGLPADILDDGLFILTIIPDESGKMTDEQRDLLREWLFAKLEAVPGASIIIKRFQNKEISRDEALRAMCGLAKEIDPTFSVPGTQTLEDVSTGKKQYSPDVALQLILASLPPKTRLIAKALMARKAFRDAKDRLFKVFSAAKEVEQAVQPSTKKSVSKAKTKRRRSSPHSKEDV